MNLASGSCGRLGIVISIKEDKIRLSHDVRTSGWQVVCAHTPNPNTFLIGSHADGSSQDVKPVRQSVFGERLRFMEKASVLYRPNLVTC
jgi:hypothetical protein